MDLLSRLIAGSSAVSPTKQKSNTAAERLSVCKRVCLSLQQIWRNGTRLSDDSPAIAQVSKLLNKLNTILHEESRKAAPHSCLLYVTSTQIYIFVTKLALSSDSAEIIGEATQFFHLLINGEAEGVLDSKIFARALIDLVRRSTIFSTIVVEEQGEADLLELLFEIVTKIRLDPDILPGWFYPEREQGRMKLAGAEARRSQFPLFYVLVDYVHHDGPIGDFARTGLLYLTETAARFPPLEKWMIESDLAPQMASGLSALYSRLSRHAPTLTADEKLPPIVLLSDTLETSPTVRDDFEESQQNIKSFLSYLAFWQDTLNHCKSPEVRETLLDHFQVLFVRQLLYPSLLESSDVAGGSTSAVILHLYRILDTVEHQDLLQRMLHYLLASSKDQTQLSKPNPSRSRVSVSRRQSIDQLASLAEVTNAPSPNLFNLLDLMVISLHSTHSQTVNASLKLITIILRQHHQYVLHHLFMTRSISFAENRFLLDDFNVTLAEILDLAGAIASTDTLDQSYEAALNDGRILLERHSCLLAKADWQLGPELADCLAVGSDCRLFGALSRLLESFFANDTVTNVALTETIIALATCEHVSMRLWLLRDTIKGDMQPTPLLVNIRGLVEQVTKWKSVVNEWDILFTYQKMRLVEGDGDEPVGRSPSIHSGASSGQRSPLIAPADRSSTPTRSTTPRARSIPPPPPAFASIDSTLAASPRSNMSPARRLAGSPLQQANVPTDVQVATSQSSASISVPSNIAILKQQIPLPTKEAAAVAFPGLAERLKRTETGSGASTPRTDTDSGAATPSIAEEIRTSASLGHIITNAIILQEFVLELAALLQIRGTFFDEVDLT